MYTYCIDKRHQHNACSRTNGAGYAKQSDEQAPGIFHKN